MEEVISILDNSRRYKPGMRALEKRLKEVEIQIAKKEAKRLANRDRQKKKKSRKSK